MGVARRLVLAGLWLAFPFPGSSATAQGTLLHGIAEVHIPSSPGPVRVTSSFTLRPDPGGRVLSLSLLAPDSIRVELLEARMAEGQWFALGSGDPAFRMTEVREHYWEGSIAIPPGVEAVTDSILVEFSFMVEGGWEGSGAGRGDAEGRRGEKGRITVPLVVPRWAPENPGPQTFRARVRIPPGFTVTGSFPTSVLRRPRPGEEGIYEMALQGLPSMLILRVSPGGGAGMTLERGLDVLVILLLLVMATLGWRYLRRNVG